MQIQMKVATGEAFSVERKYEHFDRLVMAYVWHAGRGDGAEVYAMLWTTARDIAERLGWAKTKSREKPRFGYATTRPSNEVKEAIAPHRMTPNRLRDLIDSVGGVA